MRNKRLSLLATLLFGCVEADPLQPSLILEPRVLALRSDPAEAAPGQRVSLSILAADNGGPLLDSDFRLSFCRTPKSLGDNRLASDACAQRVEQAISGFSGVVPADACARFGPNVPAGVRPSDPDITGGYYQPIRIARAEVEAVGVLRLICPLTDAPLAITRAYRERYTANQSPVLRELSITHNGEPVELGAIPVRSQLQLHSGWSVASEEPYVVYDRGERSLKDRTEALRLAWFTSSGSLAEDTTSARDAVNQYLTPDQPGLVHIWLVLRDDRGGVSYATYELEAH
ncbi:MAG TPA: hypothetical protein VMF89_11810 [Polyangiales bacterium]|nr:hypothetical protein [Polyangiales bacterium]